MTIRTIKNIPHDLLPMIRDISDQLALLRTVKNASDHTQLLDATQSNAFLIEKYLLALEKEAEAHGIVKS